MVKIRLMRVGKKKQPSYRVVVADSRSPRDGRIIEAIGNYQPRQDPVGIAIDNDRAVYWLEKGAQPSEQVKRLLRLTGAWSTFSGEPPPADVRTASASDAPAPAAPKNIKATPAASVAEEAEEAPVEETGEAAPVEEPAAAEDGE